MAKVMMVSVMVRRSGVGFKWLVKDKLGATLANGFELRHGAARIKARSEKARILEERPAFAHNIGKRPYAPPRQKS